MGEVAAARPHPRLRLGRKTTRATLAKSGSSPSTSSGPSTSRSRRRLSWPWHARTNRRSRGGWRCRRTGRGDVARKNQRSCCPVVRRWRRTDAPSRKTTALMLFASTSSNRGTAGRTTRPSLADWELEPLRGASGSRRMYGFDATAKRLRGQRWFDAAKHGAGGQKAASDGEWRDITAAELPKAVEALKSAFWNRPTQELQLDGTWVAVKPAPQ